MDKRQQMAALIDSIIVGKHQPGLSYLPGQIIILTALAGPDDIKNAQEALQEFGWKRNDPTPLGETWNEPEGGWNNPYIPIRQIPSSSSN